MVHDLRAKSSAAALISSENPMWPVAEFSSVRIQDTLQKPVHNYSTAHPQKSDLNPFRFRSSKIQEVFVEKHFRFLKNRACGAAVSAVSAVSPFDEIGEAKNPTTKTAVRLSTLPKKRE